MAFSGNNRRIIRVKVSDPTIYKIEDSAASGSIVEGFIMGTELVRQAGSDGDQAELQNQSIPKNQVAGLAWRILLPHDIASGTTTQPSPAYQTGDIIYAARLDTPIVIKNISKLTSANSANAVNNHPSVNSGLGWAQMIPHKPSFAGHYDKGTTINPKTDCIFWIDLNVDGRTRGGGSSGGSASVVWL